MDFDWVLLAEGIGQDAKGAITAIGLNQNILLAAELPAITKRAIVVHFVDHENKIKVGTDFTFAINVVNPSGMVEVAQTVQGTFVESPWPDMPLAIDLPAQFMLQPSQYGTYKITVRLTIAGGLDIKGETELHVRKPPTQS